MFSMLEVDAEIKDPPGAKPLIVKGGVVEFSEVEFLLQSRTARSCSTSIFRFPAGKTVAIVGPSGAGKSTHLAPAVPLLRHPERFH